MNKIASLGDYVEKQKYLKSIEDQISKENLAMQGIEEAPAPLVAGMSEKEQMSSGIFQPQSYSDPSKQMQNEINLMKAKAGEGGPQMSFAEPVSEAERVGLQEKLKGDASAPSDVTGAKESNEGGANIGGAAVMAGASVLKGILKGKAEKEAVEFQKKREMLEKQSEAQQKTSARNVGASMQNMQQLIANFRSAAR